MATPTPAEIKAAAAELLAGGVQTVTTEGQTATAMNPLVMIQGADALQSAQIMAAANPQGGARSAWGATLRPAQAIMPGGG